MELTEAGSSVLGGTVQGREWFDQAPVALLVLDLEMQVVDVNQGWLAVTGQDRDGVLGGPVELAFSGSEHPTEHAAWGRLRASLARVRVGGEAETLGLEEYAVASGDVRSWSVVGAPLKDGEGVVGFFLRAEDVTDYLQARRSAARGSAMVQPPVSEAGAEIYAHTQEIEILNTTMRETQVRERLTAARLASLSAAALDLAGAETRNGLFDRLSHQGRSALSADTLVLALKDAGKLSIRAVGNPLLEGVTELGMDSPLPVAEAARGSRVLIRDATSTSGEDESVTRLVRELGVTSWAAMPLRAGRTVLGSLTVGWHRVRDLDADDVELLDAFALQCAQAVERVERLEHERSRARATRSLAETLQRSLLTDPPQPEGLQVAVRYFPAAQEAQVGGDWYDAFVGRDGSTTLVIGDVTGHDRTAAATMGQLRNLLRGVAHAVDEPPSVVLGSLDQALRDLKMETLATAVLARVEEADGEGARELTWSNAGHLAPLVIDPSGRVELMERSSDLLLGLDPTSGRSDHHVRLTPGSTLVMYTDGLVERRGEDLDVGLGRLVALSSRFTELALEEFCDTLLTELAPDPDDDIALVAIRVGESSTGVSVGSGPLVGAQRIVTTPPGWAESTTAELPDDLSAARRARELLNATLESPLAERIDHDAAQLLTSELVTNAVRHGGGRVRTRLLVRAGRLRVEVHDDEGEVVPAVREASLDAESGRGMWLIDAMASRWGVVQHPDGSKDVWFELEQ